MVELAKLFQLQYIHFRWHTHAPTKVNIIKTPFYEIYWFEFIHNELHHRILILDIGCYSLHPTVCKRCNKKEEKKIVQLSSHFDIPMIRTNLYFMIAIDYKILVTTKRISSSIFLVKPKIKNFFTQSPSNKRNSLLEIRNKLKYSNCKQYTFQLIQECVIEIIFIVK